MSKNQVDPLMDKPWLQLNPYGEYEDDESDIPKPSEPDENRPKYRQSRIGRSVKVYTVALESRNIPQLGVIDELLNILRQFGEIESSKKLVDIKAEAFTDTLLVQFKNIDDARFCKNKMNRYFFYGSHLFIYYDVFSETLEDTKSKLLQRKRDIQDRVQINPINIQETESNTIQSSLLKDSLNQMNSIENINQFSESIENKKDDSIILNTQPLLSRPKFSYSYNKVYPQSNNDSTLKERIESSGTQNRIHQKLLDLNKRQQEMILEHKQQENEQIPKPKKRKRI